MKTTFQFCKMIRNQFKSSCIILLIGLLPATNIQLFAQKTPIYINDFSVRTSIGPVAEKSYTMPYNAKTLCSPNGSDPYGNKEWIQDGWVEGRNDCDLYARVNDDSGNPLACLCRGLWGRHLIVRHPTGTILSNGIVRLAGDIRPPSQWSGSSRYATLQAGYDNFMSVLYAERAVYHTYRACIFGFHSASGSETDIQFYADDGNGDGSGTNIHGTTVVDTTHWYRFIAHLDLAASTYTISIFDMGVDQPTLATPDPAAAVENFDGRTFRFRRDMTETTGGLTTLGLAAYGVMGGDHAEVDINRTARFDNLTIDAKPLGTSSFKRVYQNDFTTRTYTRLVPCSLAYNYNCNRFSAGGSYNYSAGDSLVQQNRLEYPRGDLRGTATDGWIRRNSGSSSLVIRSDDGNNYAQAWDANTQYVIACQRIGNHITNGILQAVIDITPPDKWYWTYKGTFFSIGDESLYLGEKDDSNNLFSHHTAARFGFNGEANNDIRLCFHNGNGNNGTEAVYGTASINPANWYRFVATLDLTNANYSVDVYDLGTEHSINTVTPETPIESFTGGFYRKVGDNPLTELQGISSVSIQSYGMSGGYSGTNNIEATAGYDNIVLTATLPEQEPVEIYRNLFSTRSYTNITGATRHTPMMGAIDVIGGGQDEWIRRNNGMLDADINEGTDNPHLKLSSSSGNQHTQCMQALGTDITGNILCAQIDIRPPAYWVWDSWHAAYLGLGDDRLWQGNRNDIYFFHNYSAMNFGFDSTGTWSTWWGANNTVSIYASDGDCNGAYSNKYSTATVTPGNWYRFQAEISPGENRYSLRVYDMGPSHPTLETPTPEQATAAFDDLVFTKKMRRAGDDESCLAAISAFQIAGLGVRGGQLYPPELAILVDNLLFSVKHTGTQLIIK